MSDATTSPREPQTPVDPAKDLFVAALERPDTERDEFLRDACGEDEQLFERVERLLRARRGAEGMRFLAAPEGNRGQGGKGGRLEARAIDVGTSIGPYRLERLLGEGGFGRVYLARQVEPLERTVAIKVLKPGMDSSQVLARFDAERQALSRMQHPGIATILDAGTIEGDGRPYFVMEYVEGESVTDYCDARTLEIRDRLEVFVKICLAVHHAHQKGVIHRDLKPTNLLVTERDEVPQPKVIDFGIAKAVEQPLTDQTLQTGIQVLGTPQYMSPEQANFGEVEVDTRSDIYSLGVVLYELLTGVTPFRRLRSIEQLAEVLRITREEMPQRPSTRARDAESEGEERANARRIDARGLERQLRGDLDWICLMALEKEPTRRYDSAAALARDVERYLHDEPTTAHRPSTRYLLWKFVRRHQVAVTSVVAIATAMVIGFVLAMIGLREAGAERERTRAQLRDTYLAQARASRAGMLPGKRRDALAALTRAAEIEPSMELRDEAIACLALTDVSPESHVRVQMDTLDIGPQLAGRALAMEPGGVGRVLSPITGQLITELDLAAPPWIVVFSPGGEYVATYLTDQTFEIWSVGDPPRRLLELPWRALIPDGVAFDRGETPPRWVATAERPGFVRVRSLPDMDTIGEWSLPGGHATLASAPDGTQLAVATNLNDANYTNSDISVHRLEDGELVRRIEAPTGVNIIDWSPRGALLAAGGDDARVRIWSLEDGSLLQTLEGHQGPVVRLNFDPTGELLATRAWDDTVRLWDVVVGRPIVDALRGEQLVVFAGRLVTRRADQLSTWRIERSEEMRRARTAARFGAPARLSVSADGTMFATAAVNGVHLWDADSFELLAAATETPARGAHFTRGDTRLVVSYGDELAAWSVRRTGSGVALEGRTQLAEFPSLRDSVPTGRGEEFVVITREGLYFFDAAARRVVSELPGYPGVATVPSISTDGRWLFTGTWQGEAAALWDLESGTMVRRFEGAHVVGQLDPSGRVLCVGDGTHHRFLEVGSWRELHSHLRDNGDGLAGQIAFRADGGLVALAYSRYVTRLVEPRSGRVVASFENPDGIATSDLMFDPSGTVLVGVSPTHDLLAWDLERIRARLAEMGLDWEDD